MTTTIGQYHSIKGTAFDLIISEYGTVSALVGSRCISPVRQVEPATTAAAVQGATHCIRDCDTTIGLDTATADRITTDIAAAQEAARAAEMAAAWAQTGTKLAVDVQDGWPATIGVAYPAAGRTAGTFWFLITDTLSHLRAGDLPASPPFGQTTQGGQLIELSPAEADALRACNAERDRAKAAADAAELAREAAIAAVIAAIPAAAATERKTLRRDYNRGINEGGDGKARALTGSVALCEASPDDRLLRDEQARV